MTFHGVGYTFWKLGSNMVLSEADCYLKSGFTHGRRLFWRTLTWGHGNLGIWGEKMSAAHGNFKFSRYT